MRLTLANINAIKYACLNFHYAKRTPPSKYAFNVYNDNDEWCGCILYGYGATAVMSKQFDLFQGEVLELIRVALNGKQECTSKAVAMSLRELHRIAPQVKIILSFADLDQNHAGIIYQATNWIYLGIANKNGSGSTIINGKVIHNKSLKFSGKDRMKQIRKYLDVNARPYKTKGKHKYIFVFDKKLRKQWQKKSLPYPKNEAQNES